jgi:hypothetical protein
VTSHHIAALLIAAMMYVACEISGRCSERVADHAFQLAMAIVIGVVGHAGAVMRARKPEHPGDGHQ